MSNSHYPHKQDWIDMYEAQFLYLGLSMFLNVILSVLLISSIIVRLV